jgi:hypothetical protein
MNELGDRPGLSFRSFIAARRTQKEQDAADDEALRLRQAAIAEAAAQVQSDADAAQAIENRTILQQILAAGAETAAALLEMNIRPTYELDRGQFAWPAFYWDWKTRGTDAVAHTDVEKTIGIYPVIASGTVVLYLAQTGAIHEARDRRGPAQKLADHRLLHGKYPLIVWQKWMGRIIVESQDAGKLVPVRIWKIED